MVAQVGSGRDKYRALREARPAIEGHLERCGLSITPGIAIALNGGSSRGFDQRCKVGLSGRNAAFKEQLLRRGNAFLDFRSRGATVIDPERNFRDQQAVKASFGE